MKKTALALALTAATLLSNPTLAREVRVEITNLTNGTYFTPLLVAATDRDTHLFEVGKQASAALQAMAEGGDLTGLVRQLEEAGGRYLQNPAAGLLAPGETASLTLRVGGRRGSRLSIVGMLLPTNDGFVGLDAVPVLKRGTHTYYLNGYDAGTEPNDEIVNGAGAPGIPGIPADPGGYAGSGAAGIGVAPENRLIHVHPGVLGGDDSDLDATVHRWQNPVAKVVIGPLRKKRDD